MYRCLCIELVLFSAAQPIVRRCRRKPSFDGNPTLSYFLQMKNPNPFRYFETPPEIIRLAVMMYVRFPLLLRNVEDLLHERGIHICHEIVQYWWNRFRLGVCG